MTVPGTGSGTEGDPNVTPPANPPAQAPASPPAPPPQVVTHETWYAGLDETTRTLVKNWHESQATQLKAALKTERDGRAETEKQLRDLAAAAEKGSALEGQLTEAANKLQVETKRNGYLEGAISEKVKPSMTKPLWATVQSEDLFDRKGDVDWKRVREQYPDFFESEAQTPATPQRTPSGAGAGTGTPAGQAFSMNDLIRRAAGRG